MSTTAEPLRCLTIKGTPFIWGEEQQASFNVLKQQLATSATLAYFQPDAPTELSADASPVGLVAALLQVLNGQRRPVLLPMQATRLRPWNVTTLKRNKKLWD